MNRSQLEEVRKAAEKALAVFDLNKAAQAVLDIERPGEKMREVLINCDSAVSLREIINREPASLTPAPVKTVYTLAYLSMNGVVETENLSLPRCTEFATLEAAVLELKYLRGIYSIGENYFIIQRDVAA